MNIAISLVSLGLFVLFISFYYSPRHDIYEKKVSLIEEMELKKSEGAKVGSQMKELEDTLNVYQNAFYKEQEKYNKKMQENSSQPSQIEGLDEEELIIALEDLAETTQIDMQLRLPSEGSASDSLEPNADPNNPNNGGNFMTQDKSEEIIENGQVERGTQSIIDDINSQNGQGTSPNGGVDPNTGLANQNMQQPDNNHYTFTIKGEYRSIMVFLFELRNLETPATISNFQLDYNQSENSLEKEFPLTAKFTAKFAGKEVSTDE